MGIEFVLNEHHVFALLELAFFYQSSYLIPAISDSIHVLFCLDTLSSHQLTRAIKRARPDINIIMGCQEVVTAQ